LTTRRHVSGDIGSLPRTDLRFVNC
jgi:hypothetical protein